MEIIPVLEEEYNLQLIELNQLNFSSFIYNFKELFSESFKMVFSIKISF